MAKLAGKVAIVTGAASGIGKATTRLFADEGASVVLADWDEGQGEHVMLKAGGGSIINNASIAGLIGFAGIPAYCASKGGVIQLTKTAAMEYADQGIRVNAICPGVIMSPMVERAIGGSAEAEQAFKAMEPVGRFGTPEEIAEMALFLASDDSAFCTGAPFIVDGGFVAR